MANETKKNKEKKHFFKDFKAELKKVIWPTPKQIVNNTIAVITIVIVTAIIVLVLDLAFEALNIYGINKLRDIVPAEENTSISEDIDNSSEENSEEVQTDGNTLEEENVEEVENTESTENEESQSEDTNLIQE